MIWEQDYILAQLIILRPMDILNGRYELLRICYEHVYLTSVEVGIPIYLWQNSPTTATITTTLIGLHSKFFYGRKCRSLVCWGEVGQRVMGSTTIVIKTAELIQQVRGRLHIAQSQKKSYADRHHSDHEFLVGDLLLLKDSPWKCVIRFWKWGKLGPRYIRPFRVIA